MVQLIIDFGLVVLIWMVQLIVYPAFQYYSSEDLMRWHEKYTTQISIIVIPLMFAQLGLHAYHTIFDFSISQLIMLLLVVGCWTVTFSTSAPLHGKIAAGDDLSSNTQRLTRTNWSRTFLWTAIFLIGLGDYLY